MDPTTAVPAGTDNPLEKRTCAYCKAEKVVSPATWPHRKGREGHYQAHGARCLECEKLRKAEYEKTRDDIAKRLGAPATPATDKGGKGIKRLEVDAALKAGAIALNQVAPSVMARMMQYLDDELSPHHEWALEFFAQRILPRKLFEELGGQAAGVGALNDKRPQFVVNILPAVPGAQGQVYENEVRALPPAEEDEPVLEEATVVAEPATPDPFS